MVDRSIQKVLGPLEADVMHAVWKVVAMIDRAEYKRRQAPPGVKITPKAFGRDRRMPITNRYRRDRPPPMEEAGPTSPRAEEAGQ